MIWVSDQKSNDENTTNAAAQAFDRDAERDKIHRKLKRTFKGLEGHKKAIADGLMEELASLKTEMIVCKANYEYHGSVDEMPQGEYSIIRESPYFKNYLNALKQYSAIYKQINDLYPKEEQKVTVKQEIDEMAELAKQFGM